MRRPPSLRTKNAEACSDADIHTPMLLTASNAKMLQATVRLGDGRGSVFGLPDNEADADNMLKLKITAHSYSFCPELLLNSAQLLKIFPSARLLPSRLLQACAVSHVFFCLFCVRPKKYYKMGKSQRFCITQCVNRKNYNLKMLCQTAGC
jgi:hypothetical protein